MSEKVEAKSRAELMKELRQTHEETVEQTRETLKEQQQVRKLINKELETEPKTVPMLAEATNLPPTQILWHLMAMKKYGIVQEKEMEGQYYTYQLAKESAE